MSDITVRKVRFDFEQPLDDIFAGDRPEEELYMAAFSMTLPYLEPYLIRTYRQVVDRLDDEELAADLRAFIGQEAQHHKNHRLANEAIKAQFGEPARSEFEAIEADLEADYRRFTDERSLRFNLAYAEGFEAMTCSWSVAGMLAAEKDPPTRMSNWARLWAWHSAEEIEHRTVAFRVYEDIVGSYPYRVATTLRAQAHFLRYTTRFERAFSRARGERYRPRVPRGIGIDPLRWLRTFGPRYDPAGIEVPALVDLVLASTRTTD